MSESFKLCLIFLCSCMVGCASLTERRRHQYVLIQSNPPGATILADQEVLGTTPAIIRLRRDKEKSIELQIGKETKRTDLQTRYRWQESFLENMAFLTLAPVGWLVDLSLGTSWTYKDPEAVSFQGSSPAPQSSAKFVIAPPSAQNSMISDEAAQYWQEKLPATYPNTQIKPYKETLATFQDAGFEYDTTPSDPQRIREVLYKTKSDTVFFSSVVERDGKMELSGKKVALDGRETATTKAEVAGDTENIWKGSWVERLEDSFQLIPNTIGLESGSGATNLSDGVVTYASSRTGEKNFWTDALSYLQTLTISRQQPPRMDGSGRWKFLFTPAGTFTYQKIFFPEFTKLAMVNFDYLSIGLGIGPEFGWQSGKHYTYLRFVPMAALNRIEWQQPGAGHEVAEATYIAAQLELGYLYYLTEAINFKVFTKSTSSNLEAWNKAAKKVNPTTPELTSSQQTYAGISIGYTFGSRARIHRSSSASP